MGRARPILAGLAELHEALQEEGHKAQPNLDGVPVGTYLSARDLAGWAAGRLGEKLESSTTEDRMLTLASLIEARLGIDVMIEPLGGPGLLGVSITDSEFPFILVNADVHKPRALFTLAHELGHVLAGDGDVMHVDFEETANSPKEQHANAFAAALLLPVDEIRTIKSEHEDVSAGLARMLVRFGVSYETLIYRLNNLHIIDDEHKESFLEKGRRSFLGELENSEDKNKLRAGSPPLSKRPPMLLAARCLQALRDGIASPAPLAGLLSVERSALVETLRSCEGNKEPVTVQRLLRVHQPESGATDSGEPTAF